MKVIFLILLLLAFDSSISQSSWSENKFPNKDLFLEELKEIHSIQIEKYDDKKALKDVYENRLEYVNDLFEKEIIIYNDSLYGFIDRAFNHIVDYNPELKSSEFRFLVSNSPSPNAFSIGDGTFIINLGLIRKLDNESQLAFVLSHEFSHYYLNHSNETAISVYEKTNSKAYKKEVRSIVSKEYGRYALLKSFYKKNLYAFMDYNRQQEKEADSLGLIFLKNTNYNAREAVSCMKLLDTIDYYKYNIKINYNKTLSSSEYSFKNRWLQEETTMFSKTYEDNYFERDSIKSHPDSKTRAKFLEESLENFSSPENKNFLQDKYQYEKLKYQSDYEFINSWIFYEAYGHALFYSLKQLESKPNDRYILLKISQILKLIYDSQVQHEFSQHVDRPSINNEKEYNEFLNFLDNIRLSEFGKLSYHFHLKHLKNFKDDKNFIANYNFFKTETNQ